MPVAEKVEEEEAVAETEDEECELVKDEDGAEVAPEADDVEVKYLPVVMVSKLEDEVRSVLEVAVEDGSTVMAPGASLFALKISVAFKRKGDV